MSFPLSLGFINNWLVLQCTCRCTKLKKWLVPIVNSDIINPSDQHQLSPHNINTNNYKKRYWELRK